MLVLLALALVAASVVSAPDLAHAQPTPNRAAEYTADERPWRRGGIEQALDVDFEGTGRLYRAEWRRCGPRQAEGEGDGKTIDYPTHYVTVARDAAAATPLVVFDNAADRNLTYIQSVRRLQFTRDGRRQFLGVPGGDGNG